MRIKGACHCANITIELEWPEHALPIAARICGCSFCAKHAAAWASSPGAALWVHVEQRDRLSVYRFATGVGEFHVCGRCGCVPVTTASINGNHYAVVNVNTFEGVDSSLLTRSSVAFNGETKDVRTERWLKKWIASVSFD